MALAQTGLQIDTTVRTVSSVMASGTGITAGTGDLGAGIRAALAHERCYLDGPPENLPPFEINPANGVFFGLLPRPRKNPRNE